MAETFTCNLKLILQGALAASADLTTNTCGLDYSKLYNITNGTSAGQANNLWADTRTLTASSSEDLDLYGGLTNAFGTTLNFTKIKGILIEADATNTNNVQVGGDAASLATMFGNVNDLINVRPGGLFLLYANDSTGYAVTNTTADILQIANSGSGTSVTYSIIVIGCV